MDNVNETYVKNNMLLRQYRLHNVQHVIAQVLKSLPQRAVRGIQCTKKEEKPVRLHLVLRSCSENIREQKAMTGKNIRTVECSPIKDVTL